MFRHSSRTVPPTRSSFPFCQGCGSRTAEPASHRAFDLELRALPEPMDTLAIDGTFPSEQRPNTTIAIAWMLLRQLGDICNQSLLLWAWTRLIVEGGALHLD